MEWSRSDMSKIRELGILRGLTPRPMPFGVDIEASHSLKTVPKSGCWPRPWSGVTHSTPPNLDFLLCEMG